jgi:GntR family transcriptional regulator, transcriptional repressor for pyruvate dehydrogenase complex
MVGDYKSVIEPVKSKRTFEEVSDRLKELIFNGTLKAGQQLPSENELAQLFHVGRQSVREALRVLEISGFITVRAGIKGGAVIEGTMLSKMSELFLDTFKLHRVSLEDCMEARRTIEVSVLDFATKYADKSDIEDLRKNIDNARSKLHAGQSTFEENIEFHRILAKSSKNYTLLIVMESILAVFSDLKSRAVSVSWEQSKDIIDAHEAIVDAIAAKNRKSAIAMLGKNLRIATQILIGNTL